MHDSDTTQQLSVLVTRVIPAPRDKVFAAWIDADTRRKWWFTNTDGTPAHCELDPRVGGRYLIRQIGGAEKTIPDVPANYAWEMTGEFLEIDRPNRIVFTWNVNHPNAKMTDERVTVEFADANEGTQVSITHVGMTTEQMRDGTEEGWTQILERQVQYFKSA